MKYQIFSSKEICRTEWSSDQLEIVKSLIFSAHFNDIKC